MLAALLTGFFKPSLFCSVLAHECVAGEWQCHCRGDPSPAAGAAPEPPPWKPGGVIISDQRLGHSVS